MSPALVARSADLRRLRDEGYEISVIGGKLVLSHVPYLNGKREVRFGTLVSELTLAGDTTTRPETHVVRFAGEQPCDASGRLLVKIINSPIHEKITDNLTVTFMFSSKPDAGYADYYEKLTAYIAMLATHVAAVDPNATARTFRVVEADDSGSVFHYLDTASSRAGIAPINAKLATPRVAIVGLGGTGSYLLDLIAKTPVQEIHLFDGDDLLQHNAFRAPGAASAEQLREQPKKVDHYAQVYGGMRRGLVAHPYFLDESNVDELQAMSFVFICMDQGGPKRHMIKALETFGIGFIDVGMGLYVTDDDAIAGHLRTTTSTPTRRTHVWEQRRIAFEDAADDDYGSNIQIVELNALNAALAVIKWKKLRGFYADLDHEHHNVYAIATNSLVGDDQP
ncbi:ThiF family adenylyltransferase [Micromonospora sp. 4G57]|uniref:ThiF family adenylyltransferase n=1 Tax=Micromonospora sicca TaxID=2202420 RepID=A0ABU5JNC6_9ACTN|nr:MULTISPECIES: ThiF family adenylyltransferase [unclassified Micromonospora]MDZ5447379.1 ThiF family adenylyltransferase [Micromonospora sp. 4G57]MDZ5494056.1 ThiF family adenylyltransferase [Micromonospora sp. 4G53]